MNGAKERVTYEVLGQEEHADLVGADHQLTVLLLKRSPRRLRQVSTANTQQQYTQCIRTITAVE